MHRTPSSLFVLLAFTAVSACAETPSAGPASPAQAPVAAAVPAPMQVAAPVVPATEPAPTMAADPQATPTVLPLAVVHKTPTCGCCGLWVDHLREAGFQVEVKEHEDLQPVKARLGVPGDKASCHTAEIGGFFVEGHVPADDIKRLLAQKPRARGLAVPGMPLGSPGMETPDGRVQPYTVELVQADGSTVAYATHGN